MNRNQPEASQPTVLEWTVDCRQRSSESLIRDEVRQISADLFGWMRPVRGPFILAGVVSVVLVLAGAELVLLLTDPGDSHSRGRQIAARAR